MDSRHIVIQFHVGGAWKRQHNKPTNAESEIRNMSLDTTLEHQIPDLQEFDSLRKRALGMRKDGLTFISKAYKKGGEWADPGDFVEKSLLLHALRECPDALKKLSSMRHRLENYDPLDFFKTGVFLPAKAGSAFPFLRAAVMLEALVSNPGSSLSFGWNGALIFGFSVLFKMQSRTSYWAVRDQEAPTRQAAETAFYDMAVRARGTIILADSFDYDAAALVKKLLDSKKDEIRSKFPPAMGRNTQRHPRFEPQNRGCTAKKAIVFSVRARYTHRRYCPSPEGGLQTTYASCRNLQQVDSQRRT